MLLLSLSALLVLSVFVTVLYRWVNPPITCLMLYRKLSLGVSIEKEWVHIENISPAFIHCAIASEDNHFLGHNGFDFGAIQKAIDEREKGRFRGASTISQQTAKNVFLWNKQSWLRKGLEVYFTFLIELLWNKERIMEVYLNVAEMGKGIYGVEAASAYYFRTSAKQVSPRQGALIIASLPSPLKFNPARPSAYLNTRAAQILALSAKIGKVKFDDKSIAAAKERYQKREKRRIRKNNGKRIDY